MKASLAICVAAFALAPLVRAEVVEEETWYSAEGYVVKTVKRTLSGADLRKEPTWEPAWVIRERNREVRKVTHLPPRRSWRDFSHGSRCYSPYFSGYYYPRSYYVRSGFSGYLRAGQGKPGWGFAYRAPRFNLLLAR